MATLIEHVRGIVHFNLMDLVDWVLVELNDLEFRVLVPSQILPDIESVTPYRSMCIHLGWVFNRREKSQGV